MSIETKFLIGLLLLMALGSFIASFMSGDDSAFNNLSESAITMANSFENFEVKSIGDVFYTGGQFLWALLVFIFTCVFWNFSFFSGDFVFIQVLLILINLAITLKIAFDIYRAFKPFGG